MSEYLYLAHHGVKGQKHGRRQYQNPDGSLTALGRIHYGVGAARKAAGKVGTAIRKKVKPTNAELNAKIRKEKSKILNKQKKAELKRLKKTGKIEDPTKNSPHKRYKDLTDTDIQNKINRLKKEAELAELEALQNMSPMRRKLVTSLQDGLKEGVKNATSSAIKDTGKKITDELLGKGGGKKNNNNNGKKKKDNGNSNANNENKGASKKKESSKKSKQSVVDRFLDKKEGRLDSAINRRADKRKKKISRQDQKYRIALKRHMYEQMRSSEYMRIPKNN